MHANLLAKFEKSLGLGGLNGRLSVSLPPPPPPPPPPRRPKRTIAIILVTAVTLAIAGISAYIILGPKAEFEVSSLTLSPTEAKIGEEVTVSVEVKNVGRASGVYRATLLINEKKVQEKEVMLQPGEVKIVTFTVVEDTNGTYTVGVDKLTKSFKVLTPATFKLSDLTISPSEPEIGEPIVISVTVENIGQVEGTYTVKLKINEATEDAKSVTLAGGAKGTVSFTVTRYTVGSYSIEVDGLKRSLSVLKPAPSSFKMIEPKPESINLRPTPYFSWENSKYADKYVLEIATTPNFGSTIVYRKELDSSTREQTVDTPLNSLKKYYYRVTAVNERGETVASNTPSWFTTSIIVPDTITSLAVSPDGTKAVVIYLTGKTVTVVSLTDPPHIIANLTLTSGLSDVAITYDSKYAVIVAEFGPDYVVDLNTLTFHEIVYDNPYGTGDILSQSREVITAPNKDIAFTMDLLNPRAGERGDYYGRIVSVLDVPSGRVVDYIHVYERGEREVPSGLGLYALSKDGTYLYLGSGLSKCIKTVDLPAKKAGPVLVFADIVGGPWNMELTPDGAYGLITVTKEYGTNHMWWWNIKQHQTVAEYKLPGYYRVDRRKGIAITPDGRKLVAIGAEKVGIISVANHTLVEEHHSYRETWCVVVSSNGKFALVGASGRLGILFLDEKE
jgi:hypothetical protein